MKSTIRTSPFIISITKRLGPEQEPVISAVMGSGYCKNFNDAEPADFVGHECNFCYVTSGSQTCCNAGWPRQKWLCNIICTDSGKKQCTFDSLYAKISSSDDGVSSNLDPGKKTKHILPKNCPFNSNETASLPRFDKHIPLSVAKWSITLIHRGKRLTSELYKCSPMFCVYTGFS